MLRLLRRFVGDRAGNFAMTLAIIAIPLIGAAGFGLDAVRAYNMKSRLQNAADAAAVGSIAKSSPGVLAATSMGGDGDIAEGDADAKNLFQANLDSRDLASVQKFVAQVQKDGNQVKSTVTYEATMPTTLMQVLGRKFVTLSGTASASSNMPLFADFYLLLDNTPSMGIGATPQDVATMVANTPDQCGFACHETQNPNNYYNLAKKLGVTMRIDVVGQATKSLMDTAKTYVEFPNEFRMGIYTFGKSIDDAQLQQITALTSDLDQAKSDADDIDLMTITKQGELDDMATDLNGAMKKLNNDIDKPGSGYSGASRAKYIFLVSDGVNDHANANCSQPIENSGDHRCIEPIDLKECSKIKKRGIQIAVLYTTYLNLPTNAFWTSWVKPFTPNIGPLMQSCASPGLYFEVSPTQGISDAMTALFKKIILDPRLTG